MRTNPSTLAAGLGAVKNALRKLTDQTVKMAYPMYRVSQVNREVKEDAEDVCEHWGLN